VPRVPNRMSSVCGAWVGSGVKWLMAQVLVHREHTREHTRAKEWRRRLRKGGLGKGGLGDVPTRISTLRSGSSWDGMHTRQRPGFAGCERADHQGGEIHAELSSLEGSP
jgi:hypothetical protein